VDGIAGHLGRADARGGTVLLEPLTQGLNLLTAGESGCDRVLVLIIDGQVGNEDQILEVTARMLQGVRVHTIGIDQAVNAGLLGRFAVAGGGRPDNGDGESSCRNSQPSHQLENRAVAPGASADTAAPHSGSGYVTPVHARRTSCPGTRWPKPGGRALPQRQVLSGMSR
jgi:Ca-activated chloride channel homolog